MRDKIPTSLYSAAAVAVSLTGMFLLAGVGSPGPDGAADVPEAPLMEPENRPAASGDGTAEGIKVHGHWTIEVREPDGELVTRREFENALMAEGETLLIHLLTRQRSQGYWSVILNDANDPPCRHPSDGTPIACALIEDPRGPLTIGVVGTSAGLSEFTLSGARAAQRSGRISQVLTRLTSCGPGSSPLECSQTGGPAEVFTETSIDPIEVLSGQAILVTVHISFS